MINWFKTPRQTDENNVLAVYGEVLENAFKEGTDVFDINRLPYPKEIIKTALREALESDPEDKTLINCYLYLAKFQPFPVGEIGAEDENRLLQMMEAEAQVLVNELNAL